jgi:hypothetical protein
LLLQRLTRWLLISPFRSYFQRCVVESITTIPGVLESRMKLELGGFVGGAGSDWTKPVIPVAALIFRLD